MCCRVFLWKLVGLWNPKFYYHLQQNPQKNVSNLETAVTLRKMLVFSERDCEARSQLVGHSTSYYFFVFDFIRSRSVNHRELRVAGIQMGTGGPDKIIVTVDQPECKRN